MFRPGAVVKNTPIVAACDGEKWQLDVAKLPREIGFIAGVGAERDRGRGARDCVCCSLRCRLRGRDRMRNEKGQKT